MCIDLFIFVLQKSLWCPGAANNSAALPTLAQNVPLYDISPDHSSDIFRGASLDDERAVAVIDITDDADNWEGMYTTAQYNSYSIYIV